MEQYVHSFVAFLSGTWRIWISLLAVLVAGYSLSWYLFGLRIYRAVDGKAQVKHGRLGKWQDLEEHLKQHNVDINQLGR